MMAKGLWSRRPIQMAARPFMLRAESIASPLGTKWTKPLAVASQGQSHITPLGAQHLHRTAFPGTARQGRCGAVQV